MTHLHDTVINSYRKPYKWVVHDSPYTNDTHWELHVNDQLVMVISVPDKVERDLSGTSYTVIAMDIPEGASNDYLKVINMALTEVGLEAEHLKLKPGIIGAASIDSGENFGKF